MEGDSQRLMTLNKRRVKRESFLEVFYGPMMLPNSKGAHSSQMKALSKLWIHMDCTGVRHQRLFVLPPFLVSLAAIDMGLFAAWINGKRSFMQFNRLHRLNKRILTYSNASHLPRKAGGRLAKPKMVKTDRTLRIQFECGVKVLSCSREVLLSIVDQTTLEVRVCILL